MVAMLFSAIPRPFILPAERNALAITYKALIGERSRFVGNARGSNVDAGLAGRLGLSVELPFRYPAPVEDFVQFLYDAESMTPPPWERDYPAIASEIERNVQDSNKTIYRRAGTGKELAVKIPMGPTIGLHNASSSIKQLAPLLLYLRYRAQEADLLIIDEPELDLHPEAQAKMVEVLAILVNSGINVMAITQSPYIMQHLNNLRHEHLPDETARKRMARHLFLKDPKAFLLAKDVAAYEMRDNTLKPLEDPDYGVRWDTLSDISVELQDKYFRVTEARDARTR